jgi:sterol desaturase/sphingolipid hydroxylase (fatty acid hydroxylase superfamily)
MEAASESALFVAVRDGLAVVLRPLLAFLRLDSDLYWPYLLSSLVFALLAYAYWRRRGGRHDGFLRGFLNAYFTRAIWWHRSARADYLYYFVNGMVFVLLFTPLILSGAWVAGLTRDGLAAVLGAAEPAAAGGGAVLANTVVFFLLYDFGRYLAHYILHAVPLLWEFHKVHHSAEVLTPITNARAHPVELILMASVPAALTGLSTGAFMYAYGRDVGVHTYLGLHVAIFAFSLIGNLRHSPVWFSYGPRLSYFLVSPAQHQIHHSVEPRHWGRNIGFGLAIWDWLFGTLYVPEGEEHFVMGLGDGTEGRYHGVLGMYAEPFRTAAALLRGAKEP